MSWIRLTDNYDECPKIDHLSDGAFRLWHQALAFSRRHQTDGLIPKAKMLELKNYTSKRLGELLFAGPPEMPWNPLLVKVDGFGFRLHDYLQWNPSREEENERRADSKRRMQASRERRVAPGVAPTVAVSVARNHTPVTSRVVLDRREIGTGISDSDEEILERAARLRQEDYPRWYREHTGGYLPIVESAKEIAAAADLCRGWSDARLAQIAEVILTTNDTWITSTDRGFMVFVKKASWADSRLRQLEGAA